MAVTVAKTLASAGPLLFGRWVLGEAIHSSCQGVAEVSTWGAGNQGEALPVLNPRLLCPSFWGFSEKCLLLTH